MSETDVTQDVPQPDSPDAATQTERTYSAADIEKARRQEHDKLYKRLEKSSSENAALSERLRALEAQETERAEAEAKRQQQAAKEERRRAEEEMTAKDLIAKRDQEWEARIAEIQARQQEELSRLESQRERARMEAFTSRRIHEEQDNIIPELLDYIGGATEEDVEASIERAKAKTAAIVADVKQSSERNKPPRGVAPTGYGSASPMDTETMNRPLDQENFATWSMKKYAKNRASLPTGRANSNEVGLFS